VNRNVIFLWRTRQRERMKLPVAQARTAKHDVLSRLAVDLLLFDLHLDDARRMKDDLVDPGAVTAADLAEDALEDEDETANEPTVSEQGKLDSDDGGAEDV
jgi:hypothetical protein